MSELERKEQGGGESLHPDLISSVNDDMPDEEMLYDLFGNKDSSGDDDDEEQ